MRLGSLHDRLRPARPCALYPQDSQLLGNWEMEYALAFDTPDRELSMLAERYHTPELYYQDTAHPAQMQESAQSLFCLDVPEFVVSCVQGLGDGEILIRGYQHTGHALSAAIRFLQVHSDRVAHGFYRQSPRSSGHLRRYAGIFRTARKNHDIYHPTVKRTRRL